MPLSLNINNNTNNAIIIIYKLLMYNSLSERLDKMTKFVKSANTRRKRVALNVLQV